jgi:S1-C subfamily serine protease
MSLRTSTKLLIGFLSGALLTGLILVNIGSADYAFWPFTTTSTTSSVSSVSGVVEPLSVISSQEDLIVQTVKRAEPAVTSVIITKDLPKLEQYYEEVPLGDDFGFFDDPFFRQFRMQVPRLRQKGTEKKEVGGGTAFFVTGDGLLMTNKHVVSDEKAEYTILLNDGRKLSAKVVARDPVNDVALLRVEDGNFTALPIAQSDDLSLGQTAIAIGNALGEFRNTVSVGVISGLQRSITAGSPGGDSEKLDQIIQTDAAINSGNSGGPLLSSHGEVIGMNTAVSSVGQNIGFALPARELRRVLTSYQKTGRIVRPYIGVRYMPITPEIKEKNKLAYDYGVLVVRGEQPTDLAVIPGSPADKAGIEENDIILEVDGQKLTSAVSLQQRILAKSPGDTITLKIVRKGAEKTVTVKLEEWKE